jgi:hypothetical protein
MTQTIKVPGKFMIVFTLVIVLSLGSGQEQPFYEGAQIDIVVPYSPGGGTDTFARFLQSHLSRNIEGNPSFQIINNDSGANMQAPTNYEHQVPHDGMSLLFTAASVQVSKLLGAPGSESWNFSDWIPLFGIGGTHLVYGWADQAPSLESLRERGPELFQGLGNPFGSHLLYALEISLLELDRVTPIAFYGGTSGVRLAFLNRELDLSHETGTTFEEQIGPYVETGEVAPYYQSGVLDDLGAIVRSPLFPEIPTVQEAFEQIYNRPADGPVWRAWRAIYGPSRGVTRVLFVHKDAPSAAVEELRSAVQSLVVDEEFLNDGLERGVLGEAPPMIGRSIEAEVANWSIDQETTDWIYDYLREELDVDPE